MKYSQQFVRFREARDLSQEQLAKLAGCHRNTVINVETGRPVKFETVARLMERMGFARESRETKLLAVLWLKAATGIDVTLPEARTLRRAGDAGDEVLRAKRRELRLLGDRLGVSDLELLTFAASHPEMLHVLRAIRKLVPKPA